MTPEEYEKIVKDVVGKMSHCINQGIEIEKARDANNVRKEESRIWLHLYGNYIKSGTGGDGGAVFADKALQQYKKRYPGN